tara:strand:- start:1185 stop:1883 length:699 start_codon:yes stop_codon:yes gene_type:complete
MKMTKLNITTDSYQRIETLISIRKIIRIIGITKNNVIWFLSRFIPQIESSILFAGDDKLFKQILVDSKCYGEYGVGHSTKWVYKNTYAKILAVDTSYNWAKRTEKELNFDKRVHINWADVGPVRGLGRPKNYDYRDNFDQYTSSIWNRQEKPDVVLIDGRFRVACFLNSLLNADPNTIILFDDYINRPHYHIVEEFLKPTQSCGRQACFVVPKTLNKDKIKEMYNQFLIVMD